MASTYTTLLRLTLPTQGDLTGTWGNIVNAGITQVIEDSIAGLATVVIPDANYTLTANNGVSDEARKAVLKLTGALTATRNVIVPTLSKVYIVDNSTTGGFAVTVKTAAGTGISVPNGSVYLLRCDGTNVVVAFTAHPNLQPTLVSGTNIKTVNGASLLGSGDITVGTSKVTTYATVQTFRAMWGGINANNS